MAYMPEILILLSSSFNQEPIQDNPVLFRPNITKVLNQM